MKKTLTLSILTLAISSSIYADTNTIPTSTPGFAATITGLYLQPSATNLEYEVNTTPLPAPAPNWYPQSVNPGYSGAFALGLQYTLADATDQLNLDWLHLDTTNSASIGPAAATTSIAPPYYFGPGAQALVDSAATSSVQFNVDNLNFTFGHLMNVGNHIQLEPFVGISAAYLKQYITDTYTGKNGNGNNYSISSYNTSKFTGVGPRIGIDGTYFISNQFGLTAEVGASLLAGSLESDTTFNSYSSAPGGNNTPTSTTLANESQTKILTELDRKLGVLYTIPFNSGSSLTLQAGYMIATYINAINQVTPTSLVPGAFNDGTVAIETSGTQTSDMNLNGPYASVSWKF